MMEWERLRDEWQQSASGAAPVFRPPPERLWQRVRRRDRLETLVALILVPVFGYTGWRALAGGRYLEFVFALLLVVTLVFIPLHLWRGRRGLPTASPGQSVREHLERARAAARLQSRMMRSVARWYSGPIAVGVIGLVGVQRAFDGYWLAYAGIVIVVTLIINWINARAAELVFEPVARDIDRQIRELEDLQ